MPNSNIELAREAIAAMNRRDVDWLVAHAAPDLEVKVWSYRDPAEALAQVGLED